MAKVKHILGAKEHSCRYKSAIHWTTSMFCGPHHCARSNPEVNTALVFWTVLPMEYSGGSWEHALELSNPISHFRVRFEYCVVQLLVIQCNIQYKGFYIAPFHFVMSIGLGQAFVYQLPDDTIVPHTSIQNCVWVFTVPYITTQKLPRIMLHGNMVGGETFCPHHRTWYTCTRLDQSWLLI